MDEYITFPYTPAPKFLEDVDQQGYNYVSGYFVDRAARDGSLPAISNDMDIQQQFPLKCSVIETVSKGWTSKVVAAKGIWRSSAGNHLVLNSTKDATDLFAGLHVMDSTPYGQAPNCYAANGAELDAIMRQVYPTLLPCTKPLGPCGCEVFIPKPYTTELEVHHFKWHVGIIRIMKRRLRHYRGDDVGKVRFAHYTETERILRFLLNNGMRLNISALSCTEHDAPAHRPAAVVAAAALPAGRA